jgi:hypothetical protein
MEQLPIILGALILAAILWVAKTVSGLSIEVAKVNQTLTGATGDNGLIGDMRAATAKLHEHDLQLAQLERREA